MSIMLRGNVCLLVLNAIHITIMKRSLGPPAIRAIVFVMCLAARCLSLELSEDDVKLLPPLPICDAYQACGAEVSIYPILLPNLEEDPDAVITTTQPTTTTLDAGYQALEIEGSGEGSGAEFIDSATPSTTVTNDVTVFPLYDEFVSGPAVFDYSAERNVSQKKLCRCATPEGGDENEDTCSFTNTTNTLDIDPTLKLAFCAPPTFSVRCIGRRNVVRVIAEIHESGEAIQSVLDTAVFCSCPNGFKRIGIEPWADGYAFKYQCK
uniref:Phlebovirus_G2 domain-containing protein n=1 Tax=Panagrellus redivivus TaxID=6233 RepID=A0A7E4VWW4_PANRE